MVQCGKAGLYVGARAHFGRGAKQHTHLSFPYLCKKLCFLSLCLCIVNKGDFLRRYALGHQLLLHIVVDIEGAISLWGRQVAEYKLRPLDFLRVLPNLQHIPDTGIDLTFRIVRQRRIRQPLIQGQLAAIRGDFEHIVLARLHLPVAYRFGPFPQVGHQIPLEVAGGGNFGDFLRRRNRQAQHIRRLNVSSLPPHGHEFRKIEKLCKPGLTAKARPFRGHLQSSDGFAKVGRPTIEMLQAAGL